MTQSFKSSTICVLVVGFYAICITISPRALAQHPPAIEALMSQPASMFDLGLIRIKNITDWAERWIAGYWVKGEKVLLNVNVAYHEEQIHVSISTQSTFGRHIPLTEEQMQEGCDRSLSFVAGNVRKFVPQVFLPTGDTDRAKWKDLRQQLLPLLRFSCQVYGSDGDVLYQAEQR